MKKKVPSTALPVDTAFVASASRAVFTKDFKLAAVARMRTGEQSATALALELEIRRNQLYKWAKIIDAQGADAPLAGPGRPPASEESEIARLRRELARASEELAILKKFDAYLTRRKL
jgi:transposase